MEQTKSRRIIFLHTGGTIAMGLVPGIQFKSLMSNENASSSILENELYLYALFDFRHFMIAAEIMRCSFLSNQQKEDLLIQLVDRSGYLSLQEKIADVSQRNEYTMAHLEFLEKIIHEDLKKTESSVEILQRDYGIHLEERLYNIDSRDFDLHVHYEPLLAAAKRSLEDGNTLLVVIGGTNTIEFYSGLLAKHLFQSGYLGKSNTLLFLSSMLTFGYNPEDKSNAAKAKHPMHIARYFSAVSNFANDNKPGAFALSAENSKASKIIIHNVLSGSGLIKISSRLPNALKSSCPYGVITFDESHIKMERWNEFDDVLDLEKLSVLPQVLTRVAPPILNPDLDTLKSLFKIFTNAQHSFQVLIFQLTENLLNEIYICEDLSQIIRDFQQIIQRGTHVVWFSETKFNSESNAVESQSLLLSHQYEKFRSIFLSADGLSFFIENKTLIGLYQDQLLKVVSTVIAENSVMQPLRQNEIRVLGIKYVPDSRLFAEFLLLVENFVANIVISALPGEILPEFHLDLIKQFVQNKISIYFSFSYNGVQHECGGVKFIEGLQSSDDSCYTEPSPFCGLIVNSGGRAPDEIISILREPKKINQNNLFGRQKSSQSEGNPKFMTTLQASSLPP